MTDREAFEAWAKEKGTPFHSVDRNPEYSVVAWMAWQAATAATREQCAKQLDALGCDHCADAIRKGE